MANCMLLRLRRCQKRQIHSDAGTGARSSAQRQVQAVDEALRRVEDKFIFHLETQQQ